MRKTSANDILLYEFCPHKWELSKSGIHKGKKQQFAFYRFSSALHYAINKSISEMENIFEIFENYWGRYQHDYPLFYEGDTWESLRSLGIKFLNLFSKEFYEKNITPILTENRLKMITSEWEFTGQPDLIGFRDNRNAYVDVDFKTTKEKIDEFWVHASDQMTASAMLTAN